MMVKKVIVLIVGLALPIGIFLFLRIFGENKFEVQPLFQSELPVLAKGCRDIKIPYTIPAEIVEEFNQKENGLSIVLVDAEVSTLYRIYDQFSSDPVNIERIESSTSRQDKLLKDCVFLLQSPNDVVLFDKQGVILGQYYSGDRDEIDRLILEMSILLNK